MRQLFWASCFLSGMAMSCLFPQDYISAEKCTKFCLPLSAGVLTSLISLDMGVLSCWHMKYFSNMIVLQSRDNYSHTLLWEAFADQSDLVVKTMYCFSYLWVIRRSWLGDQPRECTLKVGSLWVFELRGLVWKLFEIKFGRRRYQTGLGGFCQVFTYMEEHLCMYCACIVHVFLRGWNHFWETWKTYVKAGSSENQPAEMKWKKWDPFQILTSSVVWWSWCSHPVAMAVCIHLETHGPWVTLISGMLKCSLWTTPAEPKRAICSKLQSLTSTRKCCAR